MASHSKASHSRSTPGSGGVPPANGRARTTRPHSRPEEPPASRSNAAAATLVGEAATARAVRAISARTRLDPRLAIWLGSAFGGLADGLEIENRIPYAAIPGFACPTVAGHAGELIFGRLASVPVCLLSGRAHYYEGHDLATITFPVRVLARMGVRDLLLTNAAGGIRRDLRPGDFLLITDHINALGANPLRGLTGGRADGFLDLSGLYDADLSRLLSRAARRQRIRMRRGVYLAVSGPSYETPAEIRAFARWGADAVGMSTVPEAIVARHCKLRVAALSCITNRAAGRTRRRISHEDVLAAGVQTVGQAQRLLAGFVRLYAQQDSSRASRTLP